MQELRFVAVSEDGRYAVLAIPGRSARFTLPIDERLRAVALGQTSRLAQYEIEVESPLRPKEIQARIRAGETVEEIADAAGIAVERVRWFEGPVLAERAYVADQARSASVRRQGDAIPQSPGPRLGEIVTERMKLLGADPDDAQWDARKLGDGSWQVQLTFISSGRLHTAEWIFDPRRRHVLPADDNAVRMSLPGAEPPQPVAPAPGEATVTHLAPRLSTAAALGATGNGGRPRHERPGSGPAAAEPHGPAQPPESRGARETRETRETEAPAAVAPPVPSGRLAQPERPPQSPQPTQPARHARPPQETRPVQEGRTAQARASQDARASQETRTAQARAAQEARTPQGVARPPAPAGPARASTEAAPPPQAPTPAEPAAEPGPRPGRKAVRGKRSSVPSWDEIMFGNSRQRD